MATAEVRNHGIEITIGLTQEEATILKAMVQNSNVTGRYETPTEEGIRRVIFKALQEAGVK